MVGKKPEGKGRVEPSRMNPSYVDDDGLTDQAGVGVGVGAINFCRLTDSPFAAGS